MGNPICNRCGRTLSVKNNILCEDVLEVKKPWGYFSKKDGITQEFIMCESCVEHLVKQFVVPVKEYETKELI